MMDETHDTSHFHFIVRGTDSTGKEAFVLDWVAGSPEEALKKSLEIIPKDWSGGIEVLDEETSDEMSMPLIDYWKEPDSSHSR